MSGSSLDGVDLACCRLERKNTGWHFEILTGETVDYPSTWRKRLEQLPGSDAFAFAQTHVDYGHLLGQMAFDFIHRLQVKPDFISSHGHTVFHRPDLGFTSQIGDGAAIAAEAGLPVICDFRSMDIALAGQGAPLVPIGDKLLFSDFDFCLNLGGFANISYDDTHGKRIAFDICPANTVLNRLAQKMGYSYDPDGRLAKEGTIIEPLLDELNCLPYYNQPPPKSLWKDFTSKNIEPLLDRYPGSIPDLLRTYVEHIAIRVAASMHVKPAGKKSLVTGGGAHHIFLIERIKAHTSHSIMLPDRLIIDFKEALIFAFLGLLRMLGENNCLASVTGASRDSSGGAIYTGMRQ